MSVRIVKTGLCHFYLQIFQGSYPTYLNPIFDSEGERQRQITILTRNLFSWQYHAVKFSRSHVTLFLLVLGLGVYSTGGSVGRCLSVCSKWQLACFDSGPHWIQLTGTSRDNCIFTLPHVPQPYGRSLEPSDVLQLIAYTPSPMKHPYNLVMKNWLSNTTQNSNLAHQTQIMIAPSTLTTSNIHKKRKKNQ